MGFNRLVELDILKAMAILAIVVAHVLEIVPAFASVSWLLTLSVWIGVTGLSIFFFTSGYSLMIKKPIFDRPGDILMFLRKRFVRIYPLYWVALIVATIVISSGQSVKNLFTLTDLTALQQMLTISGLQVLFYPKLVPDLSLLWFVSVIVIFYLFFPVLIYLADRARLSFTRSLFLVALVIFVVLVAVSLITGAVGLNQVYIYYWIFIAGILLGRGTNMSAIKGATVLKICLASGVGLFLIYASGGGLLGLVGESLPPSLILIITLALIGVIGVSVSLFFVNVFKSYTTGPIAKVVERVGPSTYSIYLFHIYFLTLFAVLGASASPEAVPILVVALGIPCAIIVPVYIQALVDRTMKKYANKEAPSGSDPHS
jgi:peptidoglycan/LPS O-acetylase OafA/YrhL